MNLFAQTIEPTPPPPGYWPWPGFLYVLLAVILGIILSRVSAGYRRDKKSAEGHSDPDPPK